MLKMVQKLFWNQAGNWGLIYDMVSDGYLEVKIAHPLKVKAIA